MMEKTLTEEYTELLGTLRKDLTEAAVSLSPNEARYLVDLHYIIQEDRKRAHNQIREKEPNRLLEWFASQHRLLEANIKKALDIYTDNHYMGQWAKSIHGIGPIIAAGLLAHIDIEKAPTAGAIWRYAGLDPSKKWIGSEDAKQIIKDVLLGNKVITGEHVGAIASKANMKTESLAMLATNEKGKITKDSLASAIAKRPWNADLKVLCWKIGESFVKGSGSPKDFYGKFYRERKEFETAENARLAYKDQAAHILETKKIGKDTIAYGWYVKGMLPPNHIHSRAKRYAVKIFLSHFFEVWYRYHYKKEPPLPYAIEHLGHAHKIDVPA